MVNRGFQIMNVKLLNGGKGPQYSGDPTVFPNADWGIVSNSPKTPFFQPVLSYTNLSPSIRWVCTQVGFKKRGVSKVSSYIDIMEARLIILKNMPPLFDQKGKAEGAQILEAHVFLTLRDTHFVSTNLMYLSLTLLLTPPKVGHVSISNSVLRVFRILKQLMAKVGMAKATAFRSTSLPPWNKSFHFHVCKLCQSFALISEKAVFLKWPIMGWRPK